MSDSDFRPGAPSRRDPDDVAPFSAPRVSGPDPMGVASLWQRELPDLDVTNIVLASMVHRIAQLLEQDFTELTKEYDLLPSEMRILLALRRSPPDYALSPTQLFRRLMVTSGAVTKQVNRLCERGLVSRHLDPQTPRGQLARLEPAGRHIADQAVRRMCTVHAGLETLDRAEAHQDIVMLQRVLAVLDPSVGSPDSHGHG
ncbi:MarR family winged helix-turn-helix transcriptional regulator [Planotetraspora mira]|uniref:MarR family transcriptional regulator n=1 Tax=Planotetraspora mira TaxID=58121 RepID=A0A8J3TNF8_9ACTN|nr:MarR family winged helix-turn-helix transcriptional regulator [Planotetraspora mira]GII28407.1 MarR family transcriptional regulator [Planotetraspora mira]